MSDDLVERVARVMAVAEGFDPDLIINNDTPDCPQPLWRLYRRSARAAIAVVLDEAADYCEMKAKHYWGDGRDCCDAALQQTAAAIRALKEEPRDE